MAAEPRTTSASGDHDVHAKRVRRTMEPEFKACADDALDAPWTDVGVSDETRYAMAAVCHFSHATYVQAATIPKFRRPGCSMVVEAATGSGKTLAFVLPTLERMLAEAHGHFNQHNTPLRSRRIVGMITAPSRVLAQQTFIVARSVTCRCAQFIRFALCDESVEPVANTVAHLRRAAKLTGTFLVGTPKDIAAVCDGLARAGSDAATGAEREAADSVSEGSDMDDEEREILRRAKERVADRAKRHRAEQSTRTAKAAGQPRGPARAVDEDDVPVVCANPGAPFLVIVDEADVVLKSTPQRQHLLDIVAQARRNGSNIDVGLFGATVSSSAEAKAFLEAMELRDAPLSITLGTNEQYVSKLTNKYSLVRSSGMIEALVHMINAHPSKKHFVFFNTPEVLLHVKSVLQRLTDGKFPLLHVGQVFMLHEGMKDSQKYGEFSRFLQYSSAEEDRKATDAKEAAVKRRSKMALECGPRLQGNASGDKRSATHIGKATGAVLLCTDVAAFGLDVRDVEYVVHFEAPRSTRSYIHRIGRVGRMGMRGSSTILLPADGASADRTKSYIAALVAAYHAEEGSVGGGARAPIESNIRAVISTSGGLLDAAKRCVQPMLAAYMTDDVKEASWFDEHTALAALSGGALP